MLNLEQSLSCFQGSPLSSYLADALKNLYSTTVLYIFILIMLWITTDQYYYYPVRKLIELFERKARLNREISHSNYEFWSLFRRKKSIKRVENNNEGEIPSNEEDDIDLTEMQVSILYFENILLAISILLFIGYSLILKEQEKPKTQYELFLEKFWMFIDYLKELGYNSIHYFKLQSIDV